MVEQIVLLIMAGLARNDFLADTGMPRFASMGDFGWVPSAIPCTWPTRGSGVGSSFQHLQRVQQI